MESSRERPKQVQFRPPPPLLNRMERECEKLGILMPKLLEEAVRYFLDRDLYTLREQKEFEKALDDYFRDDAFKLKLSLALDEVLDERARRKYGDDL